MKRLVVQAVLVVAAVFICVPASAAAANGTAASNPAAASNGIEHLDYAAGPYHISPGTNLILTQYNHVPKPNVNGFMIRFAPNLRYALPDGKCCGKVPLTSIVHLHHGVWLSDGAAVANAKTTVAINNTTPRLQAHTAPQRCQLTVARVNPSGLIQSVLIQYGAGVAPAPEGI